MAELRVERRVNPSKGVANWQSLAVP
jgi:hypothetical protein